MQSNQTLFIINMVMSPKHEISLLPKEEFERKAIGRFLIWSLSVGRWIIVFTEFIVICAFLSRFYLDRRISDLHEDIFQKQAIVKAMNGFEEEFTFLQERLKTIDNLTAYSTPNEILEAIMPLVPTDVSLDDFEFSKDKVQISAVALSYEGLNSFRQNLDKYENFAKVEVIQVSKDEKKAGIEFTITADLFKKE